ncbi:MAG: MMPL family transporter, partial [Myxococcales bacterium]|nr:MMPL family transporter [Myxococcales bacterium]
AAAGAARARAAVEGDRLAPGLLVSRDARAFSVTCIVEDITSEDDAAVLAAIAAAAPRLPTWRSGGPVFRTRVSEWTRDELARLVPATAATIALLVAIVFGASWHVVVPLLTGGLGSVVVLAAMARAGVAMTLTGAILPSVLLALGCAYALHVMAAFRACDDDVDARAEALRGLVRPIGLSGATTAIGFVAMSFVHIDVVRHVGVFGAVGTLVVMLASITFAPACLRGLHGRAPTRVWSWLASRAPERVFRLVAARPRSTIAAWLAVAAAVGVGIARLEVETDVVLWFQRGSAVREDYEAIRAALAGISPMNVVVESRAGRAVTEPDVVRALAGLTEFLEAQPEMGRAISLADPLRQLHGGFLGDASQPLPTTRPQAEQYLLLLESVDSIRDLVASDRASANVLLRVDENGSNALVSLARRAEAWWRDHGPADFAASTTGVMHEYAVSENEIARGQLVGLAFALGSIGGLLVLVTRSARLAALALVPNVVPIVLLFGAMGLAGVPLDAGTVLIGCLALGIAVDDTIHLLERFRAGVARGAREALRAALAQTLPAIALTSIAVGAGFAALAISPFVLVRNLGVLTSAVMVACLLADLLLLPPLLLLAFGRAGASTGAGDPAEGPGAASSS